MERKINVGARVLHGVSGFKGTVTARTEYLGGSPRLEVTANGLNDDGRPISEWFNESNVSLIEE
jgi:hypothetical protein